MSDGQSSRLTRSKTATQASPTSTPPDGFQDPPLPAPAVINAAVLAAVKTAQDALDHAPLTTIIADLETDELACRPCCVYMFFCCLRLRKRRVAQLLHIPADPSPAPPAAPGAPGAPA